MFHRRLAVRIQLNLHAITCPGVWLCSHGYLEATIKTLGFYLRTGAMEPRFPLLCHDQFTMEGYFKSVGSRHDVERLLAAEQLELTLWQNGRRLAHYVGKLTDVLRGVGSGQSSSERESNVDLLMKTTPAFPGILAPKVAMSSEWSIRDRSLRRGSGGSEALSMATTLADVPSFGGIPEEEEPAVEPSGEGFWGHEGMGVATARRQQKPVCHTKQHLCSFAATTNGGADKPSTLRRLSTTSSHLSSSTLLSQLSTAPSSYCRHSNATSLAEPGSTLCLSAAMHQRQCSICQRYCEAFS